MASIIRPGRSYRWLPAATRRHVKHGDTRETQVYVRTGMRRLWQRDAVEVAACALARIGVNGWAYGGLHNLGNRGGR